MNLISLVKNTQLITISVHRGGCAVAWGQVPWRGSSTESKDTIVKEGRNFVYVFRKIQYSVYRKQFIQPSSIIFRLCCLILIKMSWDIMPIYTKAYF